MPLTGPLALLKMVFEQDHEGTVYEFDPSLTLGPLEPFTNVN